VQCNLQFVAARLDGEDAQPHPHAYRDAGQLLEDLYLVRDSLVQHGDRIVAEGELQDLIRQVETFGFHLVELDVRQESSRHTEAIAELVAATQPGVDYAALETAERIQLLCGIIADENPLAVNGGLSERTRETLEVFGVMARMLDEAGPRTFGAYVISMTHEATDVLAVLALARQADLVGRRDGEWFCKIRVSPLFETIADLHNIERVMDTLLVQPLYASLLRAAGGVQEVMLGYSDSCPEFGVRAVRRPEAGHRAMRPLRFPDAAVPRPRRHHRARRRSHPRIHPGAAARHRARQDQVHGAGRGSLLQVQQHGDRGV